MMAEEHKKRKILRLAIWGLLPVSLLLLLLIGCCGREDGVFTVKAGNHYSTWVYPPNIYFGGKQLRFRYRIDDGWFAANNKDGISKIYGFSEGHHHWNSSARLGFIVRDNVIMVKAYCYADGVSPQQDEALKPTIRTIEPNRWYSCSISREDGFYVFRHEGAQEVKVNAGKPHSWGYMLFPYIGGRFTLDKDIKIEISLPD